MRHLLRVALALLLGYGAYGSHGAGAHASEIGVTPVVVQLDRLNDRAAVTVVNNGSEPVIMQVEMVGWKRTDAGDEDVPTVDMVVSPSVFTVRPGGSQLVRVGLRRNLPLQREGAYRIVLREVPPPPSADNLRISGQVRVLIALRVPVYVAPARVVRAAQWRALWENDGTVTASVRNEGNVHIRVGRIQVRSSNGRVTPAEEAPVAVAFPGERQSFRFPGLAGGGNQPTTLEVMTNNGPQIGPITVAQR